MILTSRVWELWEALLHSSQLVVVPHLLSRSPAEFLHLLAGRQLTVLNQTPSAFYQLMQAEGKKPNWNRTWLYVT
jgi:nonribosomal peptide synthetase DhbF